MSKLHNLQKYYSINKMSGGSRYCKDCRIQTGEVFKKILDLQNSSGLVIYLHKQNDPKIQKRSTEVLKNEFYILHNTTNVSINRPVFMFELSQYKTKCVLCKMNINKVRSLLNEITSIRGKEILSKCQYCKQFNLASKCQRCEYIVEKFLSIKKKEREEHQNSFEQWLDKVRLFLQSLSEGELICRQAINQESSLTDYEKLLNQLDSPKLSRKLDIRLFPDESDCINENKVMLQEIITNLETESFNKLNPSDGNLYVPPLHTARSCICKHFMNNYNKQLLIGNKFSIQPTETRVETGTKDLPERSVVKLKPSKEISPKLETKTKKIKRIKTSDEVIRENKVQDRKSKHYKENVILEKQNEKSLKIEKPKKGVFTSEEKSLVKTTKERGKEKKLNTAVKPDKIKLLPKILDLPELKIPAIPDLTEESSENVIECGHQHPLHQTEMIKRNEVIHINCHDKTDDSDSAKPLFFQVKSECADVATDPFLSHYSISEANKVSKLKKTNDEYENSNSKSREGVICYQLSNREFIDKGWTKLPVKKIMRRMNVYKMISTNPKFDWFERNKSKRVLYYASGEKLAAIEENGCGRWYYKNGAVALDYYKAEELNAGQRYVIYSSGNERDNGKLIPITVLASFDFLGNGVVYDHYGNIRLKYNQAEGIVIDDKIAPRGRWKWHTLNDPPVLQPVLLNIYDNEKKLCLQDELNENKEETVKNIANQEMLTIELDNFVRDKANKILRKFKPFHIRMKFLKINETFSLRIIDQANIYILFRDGQVSLKLNLGMLLLSNEIIDTETAEVSRVATPYDRNPATSASMASIQNTLRKAKRIGKRRGVPEFISLPPLVPKNYHDHSFM